VLGDTTYDDASYAGEAGGSVTSMQYYRDKAREFQESLNRVDIVATAAREAMNAGISAELSSDLAAMLDDLDARKITFRLTAEGINAGAAVINALGGRFPQLSVPKGLGFLPAIPIATIAALGVAASLVAWGTTWMVGVNERLKLESLLGGGADPDKLAEIEGRVAVASASNWLSDTAGIVKWGAIALLGYFAYTAFSKSR